MSGFEKLMSVVFAAGTAYTIFLIWLTLIFPILITYYLRVIAQCLRASKKRQEELMEIRRKEHLERHKNVE